MISQVEGKIIEKNSDSLVILTAGGIGYKIYVKPNSIDNYELNTECNLLTHLIVREDAMDLYGFVDNRERSLFINLLSVSGIGPRSALHLLSLGSSEEIAGAISRGDVGYLSQVSGVGKKTAERVVVELKSKMGEAELFGFNNGENEELSDVMEGLVAMGYSGQQAREALKKIITKGKSSEQLLREALQNLG